MKQGDCCIFLKIHPLRSTDALIISTVRDPEGLIILKIQLQHPTLLPTANDG
ncbi:MAG: hypothetical protein ACI9G6_001472 [Limisphaerales bacterium]